MDIPYYDFLIKVSVNHLARINSLPLTSPLTAFAHRRFRRRQDGPVGEVL